MDNDNNEVRSTGGKSFVPAYCGRKLEYGRDDANIGYQNQQQGDNQDQRAEHDNDNLTKVGMVRCYLKNRRDVTEEVVQLVGGVKGQVKYQGCDDLCDSKAAGTGSSHQSQAHPMPHEQCVAQRVTDGHVAIITHGCQQEGVRATQKEEGKHLDGTAQEGDGLLLGQQVNQHLGYNDEGVTSLRAGEDTKEEVHGGVEGSVQHNGRNDDGIGAQHEQVHKQEDSKEQPLQPSQR